VVPEIFATWALVRAGELTSGTTVVVVDNLATLSRGFAPLAFAATAIDDLALYVVNLAAVGGLAVILGLGLRLGRRGAEGLATVLALVAACLLWVAVVLLGPLSS
jgi:cation:H+ antiporter